MQPQGSPKEDKLIISFDTILLTQNHLIPQDLSFLARISKLLNNAAQEQFKSVFPQKLQEHAILEPETNTILPLSSWPEPLIKELKRGAGYNFQAGSTETITDLNQVTAPFDALKVPQDAQNFIVALYHQHGGFLNNLFGHILISSTLELTDSENPTSLQKYFKAVNHYKTALQSYDPTTNSLVIRTINTDPEGTPRFNVDCVVNLTTHTLHYENCQLCFDQADLLPTQLTALTAKFGPPNPQGVLAITTPEVAQFRANLTELVQEANQPTNTDIKQQILEHARNIENLAQEIPTFLTPKLQSFSKLTPLPQDTLPRQTTQEVKLPRWKQLILELLEFLKNCCKMVIPLRIPTWAKKSEKPELANDQPSAPNPK